MSGTAISESVRPAAAETQARRPRFFRNPWRHPWFLEGFTWLYLIWSLVPILIAVLFSFNKGKSQASYQGLTWRWYWGTRSTRSGTTPSCTVPSSRHSSCPRSRR